MQVFKYVFLIQSLLLLLFIKPGHVASSHSISIIASMSEYKHEKHLMASKHRLLYVGWEGGGGPFSSFLLAVLACYQKDEILSS